MHCCGSLDGTAGEVNDPGLFPDAESGCQFRIAVSGRVQKETAGGNKMRLSPPKFSSPAGRATNPRCSRQNTGSSAVCWRGRASGGNGLPSLARVAAGRHRVTDSLRPRQQARPGLCIRTWINELAPRIQTTEPSLLLYPQQVSFSTPADTISDCGRKRRRQDSAREHPIRLPGSSQ